MANLKTPKQHVKILPKLKEHNCEFHPRMQMKKGTTYDFSKQRIKGPRIWQPQLHIPKKPQPVKVFSNKKPLSRKDRRHLLRFDIRKAFLQSLNNEPTLSLPNKKEGTYVECPYTGNEKIGDWLSENLAIGFIQRKHRCIENNWSEMEKSLGSELVNLW
jgi:hypothetical protein